MKKTMNNCMGYIFCWITVAVSLLMLGGCHTPQMITQTVYRDRYQVKTDTLCQRDSIFLHDSVLIRSMGDTTLIEKWHTNYRNRYIYLSNRDTIRDTINVTQTVTLTEEQKTPWYLILFRIIVMLCSIIVIYNFILWLTKR